MFVNILREEGYALALQGLAYSFKDPLEPIESFWSADKQLRMEKVSANLADKGAGHNKFLRQIVFWVDIVAPRYWWSEFDTYKIGTVAQSESTMHKLAKRRPEYADFAPSTPAYTIEAFRTAWEHNKHNIQTLKACLPEGYLQRRLVTMNYETLRAIIDQRATHRLPEWPDFIKQMRTQVRHPELLP